MFDELYTLLRDRFNYQNWWPGETTDEIIIGAVLTQNTSWGNVEKVIHTLKENNALDLKVLYKTDDTLLEQWIRPSGYFRQKVRKLKCVSLFFRDKCDYQYQSLEKEDKNILRKELLSVWGVGPETADSILLYALKIPFFVIDAYTRRILERHHLSQPKDSYDSLRINFEKKLKEDIDLWGDLHALIVKVCKEFCRKTNPLCEKCPLKGWNL